MNFDASRFQYMSFIATICIMSTMVLPAIVPNESIMLIMSIVPIMPIMPIMLIMPIMPIITSISSTETELQFLCISSKETEFSFLEINITHHMELGHL